MDRCYKFIVSLFIISVISFIKTDNILAYDYYLYKNNKINHNELIKTNEFILSKAILMHKNDNKNIVDNEEDESEKKAVINLNEDQLFLLSKLVAGEARGESYEGQVAVAAVVINRVKDSRFPNSIEGVIYQRNAFSVVRNGYISTQPTSTSYKAAQEALYGNDPTNNAIYFWNPDISTCNWVNTLNPHLRIGNHVFAK